MGGLRLRRRKLVRGQQNNGGVYDSLDPADVISHNIEIDDMGEEEKMWRWLPWQKERAGRTPALQPDHRRQFSPDSQTA